MLDPLSYKLARAIMDDPIRDAGNRAAEPDRTSPDALHRFQMPEVREIVAPRPRRRLRQRELVTASLLRCSGSDSATRRRRP